MNICVFGASSATLDDIYYKEAEALGRELALRGHTLVFGGGKEGLMGAAARGASAVGGEIIGIAPRFFNEPGILYEQCTELVLTETMRERKQLMEERSQACIALPGGIGTFEEFFEILTLKQLGRSSRAIVLLDTDGCYAPLQALLESCAERRFMSKNCLGLYKTVSDPKDALDYIESYVPQSGSIHRLSDYNA